MQISNLFGVSMDYLLKEDCEEKSVSEEKTVSNSGYYVSQEMLDGYLSYSRQNVFRSNSIRRSKANALHLMIRYLGSLRNSGKKEEKNIQS